MENKKIGHILKIFIVCVIIAFGFSLFTDSGTSDVPGWGNYIIASINRDFVSAHIKAFVLYPFFSTVIMGTFGNIWVHLVSPKLNTDYVLKASVIFFYFVTMALVMKFSYMANKDKKFTLLDRVLVFVTAFSVFVSVFGMSYVDIYPIPAIVGSLIAIFKKKYVWAGILIGLAATTKFEPVVIIPILGATAFDVSAGLKNIKPAFLNALKFVAGFIPTFIVFWGIVYFAKGGKDVVETAWSILLHPTYLAANSMNVNWILTYILHIVNPATYISLDVTKGVNSIIGGDSIFITRYIFYFIVGAVLLRYWLKMKKNPENILGVIAIAYFSHYMVNREAHEQHFFYGVIAMLMLYLVKPTESHRNFLILFDIINLLAMVTFYGITGTQIFTRVAFGFDLTVLVAVVFTLVYIWVLYIYFRKSRLDLGQ